MVAFAMVCSGCFGLQKNWLNWLMSSKSASTFEWQLTQWWRALANCLEAETEQFWLYDDIWQKLDAGLVHFEIYFNVGEGGWGVTVVGNDNII